MVAPESSSIRVHINELGSHFATILIDGSFLLIWVTTQWGLNWVLEQLPLEGLDAWVLTVLKALFAAATVAPVVYYTYVDLRIIHMRSRARLRAAAVELGEGEE